MPTNSSCWLQDRNKRFMRNSAIPPANASGMLEAIRDDGFVISVEDRVVFIPRSAVLQMELYETSELGSTLRLE
jgi:hypothetical protein